MMVIGLTQPQEIENLQLEVNISTTLGITAEQARRKVTRFLTEITNNAQRLAQAAAHPTVG